MKANATMENGQDIGHDGQETNNKILPSGKEEYKPAENSTGSETHEQSKHKIDGKSFRLFPKHLEREVKRGLSQLGITTKADAVYGQVGATKATPHKNKITLQEFLSNDGWWNNHFQDTSQLPLELIKKPRDEIEAENSFYVYDPYNRIVGHEKEKEVSKAAVLNFLATSAMIRKRKAELASMGFSESMPPGRCIIDILREEFPTMPMTVRIGPYAGGKTLGQECEEEFLFMKRKEFGLAGYDYVAVRDRKSPLEFKLEEVSSPNGIEDVEEYNFMKETKSTVKKWGVRSMLLGGGLFISYVLADFTLQYYPLIQAYGINPLYWFFDNFSYILQDGSYIATFGILGALSYYFNKKLNKGKSKDPNLLSTGEERPTPYVGHETVDDLLGKYIEDKETPPQFRIKKLSDILKANEKVFIVENLHELSREVQQNLAQIIEERYVDVAGQNLRKFVYSLVSVGLNVEKMSKLEEALKNRLNYADRMFVSNDVQKYQDLAVYDAKTGSAFIKPSPSVEKTPLNLRHMYLFIADVASRSFGIPWKKDSCDELLDYCSRLSDDVDSIRIDRGVINVINQAEKFAKTEGSKYVKVNHVINAERSYRSLVQLAMEGKIKEYEKEAGVELKRDELYYKEIGTSRVIISYRDKDLQEYGEGLREGAYEYERSEDYIGVIVKINASVSKRKEGEDEQFDIISGNAAINKDFYKASLRALFMRERIDLSSYNISLSIPTLSDDDAILAGAYSSLKSAIMSKGIRQDRYIVAKLTETGELTSLRKLNTRLSAIDNSHQGAIISVYDYKHKVLLKEDDRTLYPNIEQHIVKDLSGLMEALS